MNAPQWLVFGVLATAVMTTMMVAAQGVGLTRISLPFILGSMLTRHRHRARVIGYFAHLSVGLAFLLLYVAAFEVLGGATPWYGAAFGLLHALVVLTIGFELLPGLHPRMASEHAGPTAVKRLEPPGFFGLHYGAPTPAVVIVGHVTYGALFGWLYTV